MDDTYKHTNTEWVLVLMKHKHESHTRRQHLMYNNMSIALFHNDFPLAVGSQNTVY